MTKILGYIVTSYGGAHCLGKAGVLVLGGPHVTLFPTWRLARREVDKSARAPGLSGYYRIRPLRSAP